jgi:hypothetical protein
MFDRALGEAQRNQLPASYYAVLPVGQSPDRRVRTFPRHRGDKCELSEILPLAQAALDSAQAP